MIEAALRESGGRVSGPSGAAAELGISRSTLESKIAPWRSTSIALRLQAPRRILNRVSPTRRKPYSTCCTNFRQLLKSRAFR